MVPEAPLELTERGLVPNGEGWFVLNARDAEWRHVDGRTGVCDPGTKHTIVGAGDGPCAGLAVGACDRSVGPDWGGYTVDDAASRHGVSVEEDTTDPSQAYARFARRAAARYVDGWLPAEPDR